MENRSVVYLTDDLIRIFSGDNVLTEYRDLYMKTDYINAYSKGIYDPEIFGSLYSNRCNCGKIKVRGVHCTECKSTALTLEEQWRKFARIELPFYYCPSLNQDHLIRFLKNNFQFEWDIESLEFDRVINMKTLEILQFNYDPDSEIITVTDDITEIKKCSFEGLLQIITNYYPQLLQEYSSYINSMILVIPMVYRPPRPQYDGGVKTLKNDRLSSIYKNIIYAVEEYYKKMVTELIDPESVVMLRATLRRFLSQSLDNLSELLLPSKANHARSMNSYRLGDSGRCTIVPATDLKIDEAYVPIGLMYECCEREFIQFLQDEYGYSRNEAEIMYRYKANTNEVIDLFEKYIAGDPDDPNSAKYVFLNRAPSLHELNFMMFKVKLTRDFCIKIPQPVCPSFNADFDGDTMAFYAVPKEKNAECLAVMSPRNLIYYKKDHNPLFMPKHEFMAGLIYGTKVTMVDNPMQFDSLEEGIQYRRKTRGYRWQTQCFINGKETTLARAKLSELFGVDIDEYIKSCADEGEFKNGKIPSLTAKNIIPLYANLARFQDRAERIQQIQEFSSNIATISGATTPSLEELHEGIDSKYLDQIREIEHEDHLSQREKEVAIREIYGKYIDDIQDKFSDSVKLVITEGSRAKINQVMNMVAVQLNIGPDYSVNVGETRLIDGMSSRDYEHLAIENRAVQDIKQDGVPLGGYLTRQFYFVAARYYFRDDTDPTNKGIYLMTKDALGRTTVEGTIVEDTPENKRSEELVRVRSIIGSTYPNPNVVTKDMITNMFDYRDNSKIGMSMMTSSTEQLTQASLGLKHGGALFQLEPNGNLIATQDCELVITDQFLIVKGADHISRVYPRPNNFVQSFANGGNHYKKGDVIGCTYRLSTATYALDAIIKLCGARSTNPRKAFAKNHVLISSCYAMESGVITYKPDADGNIHLRIGSKEYPYNPDCLYFIPEGTHVEKYTRICSGYLDMPALTNYIHNYEDMFYFFRKQMKELVPSLASEMIEMIYSLIVTKSKDRIRLTNINSEIHNSESLPTAQAYAEGRKLLKGIPYTGRSFVGDAMSTPKLYLFMGDSGIPKLGK